MERRVLSGLAGLAGVRLARKREGSPVWDAIYYYYYYFNPYQKNEK